MDAKHTRRVNGPVMALLAAVLGAAGCQSGSRPLVPTQSVGTRVSYDAAAEPPPRDLPPVPVVPAPAGERPIDLATALELAGVDNPTIALAEEAVQASRAELLQAQALLLPNLDAGASVNVHRGTLESARGIIRDLHRQSLYVGDGASAVGAGTVGFPGVQLTAHVSDALFEPRAARQVVAGRQFDAVATRNAVLLEVTDRHFALAGAEASLRAARQTEDDEARLVELTANFARSREGREGDAQRARSDALLLHTEEERAEESVAVAAAELARLLDLDPSVRLRTPDGLVPTVEFFGPHPDLEALVQTAVDNRPEVGARSADVGAAETRLREEKWRPALPLLLVGFSAGDFGGGGDQVDSRFGRLAGRTDFDAAAVWSLRNFGLGDLAVQRRRRAEVGLAVGERVRVIDQIRREVVEAYALAESRRREMEVADRRVRNAEEAFRLDVERARNLKGLPIETLDSLRQLDASRQELIRSVVEFNQAQFRLWVALGRPPAQALSGGADCP